MAIANDLEYLLNVEQINTARLKKVDFKQVPMWLEGLISDFKKENYCHYNATKTVLLLNEKFNRLQVNKTNDIKYVIGLIVGLDVHEHAFIKIGEHYFDPTISVEKTKDYEVYSLLELNVDEMQSLIEKNDMHEHGLLMMTIRTDERYAELFSRPIDLIAKEIQENLESYLESNNNSLIKLS